MIIKINDLEDRLLETQLQLERVSDDKLTHMFSIQKCPTDKTELGYVPTSNSDTPSTSKTIFVRPVIPESPPSRMDKGKTVMEGEVPFNPQPPVKLPIKKKPPTCHYCGKLRHIRPNFPHWEVQQKKKWLAPKTPMCHQCRVSSHIRPRCPPPKPPKHHRSPLRNHVPKLQQLQKPTQVKKTWIPKKTTAREISSEGTFPPVLSCKIWSDFWLYSFRRKDRTRMRTLTPRGGTDLPSR